jgi:hypothetical protein
VRKTGKLYAGYAQSVQSVTFAICGYGETFWIVKSVCTALARGALKSTSK